MEAENLLTSFLIAAFGSILIIAVWMVVSFMIGFIGIILTVAVLFVALFLVLLKMID